MISTNLPHPDEMYTALANRDAGYEGVFFTAVKTTGIFCRPTCPARKPKRENVEFFGTTRDALMAGLRAGGIGTQLHYYPVPLQPWFRRGRPIKEGAEGADVAAEFPAAVDHARRSLSLPLHPTLDEADQDRVVAGIAELLGRDG